MSESKRNLMILMADDDTDFYQLSARALKQVSPEVDFRYVEDGEELIDYLNRRGKYQDTAPDATTRPSLIFLDLNMPRKNGFETLKEIKANAMLRHIPIVMMTISNNNAEVKMCYSLGANSFITKPFQYDDLIQMMKDVRNYWFNLAKIP